LLAVTVRDDLHEWLSEQPLWQQDLALRLVVRTHLEDDQYEEAERMVRGAFDALAKDESAPAPRPITLEDLPAGTSTDEPPQLVGFGNMRGVGSVVADQELSFEPHGLTLIYGPNAVGKTTYVRALKRVCRTVDCDAEIIGNVFAGPAAGNPAPSAKVDLLVDGERRGQQLNLKDPPKLGLEGISVFDARCAELYVDAENAVAYIPSALLVLTRLAATQDHMRQSIAAQIEQLQTEAPAFAELGADTAAKQRTEKLTATTDLEELRQFTALDDTERTRLVEVRAVIASAEAKTTRVTAQAAQADATQAAALAQKLRDLGARVEAPAMQVLRELAIDDVQAKAAVELAVTEFAALPVSGVGGEPWERLWRAAREFSEQQQASFPPGSDECCPLCLQKLDPDAADRMAHFEKHVQSSIAQEASRARQALAGALETVDERHVSACRTEFLQSLKTRNEQLHDSIEHYLDAISRRMTELRGNPADSKILAVLEDPAESLERWGQARAEQAQALLAAEDPERERELRAELAELDAREKLQARLDEIGKWVSILKRIGALRRAHGTLATNRITTQQRRLSEALVSETLTQELQEEVRKLRCEHLPVDLEPHTNVGQTQVKLRLAGAHNIPQISEILSEGERRALSLAFFLAEVNTSGERGGIIVDDPVSSLDDTRRAYIAERLVIEAKHRQVIVFTHDIHFLIDLTDQAEANNIVPLVQGVWRMGSEVGRVDDHPPFATLKLRSRIGVLAQEVEQWDKQDAASDFDEAWRRICNFYDRLRKTWERAVEERLFRGVVQRFQREVKTLALKDVHVTRELIAAITASMTRCSTFVHDAPPSAGTSLPGRTELAEDLAKLQAFEKETRL
jgi:energy-coupling factor transporter ATP-binding protein EcfA2